MKTTARLLLTFTITLISSLTAAFAASGIGGSGGGPRMESARGQLVTVEVCDGGESGTMCRQVTYRVRPQTKAEPVKCTVVQGEALEVPCPKSYGVPKWMKKLNEAFGEHTTPPPQNDYVGGP